MKYERVQDVLRELQGKRCENVDNPHGSILRLDIGTMGRRADDPAAPLHGWRHITILSPWRLESAAEVIADWNTRGGSGGSLFNAVRRLRGDTVQHASAQPPGWDLVIEWSSGLRLFVFADSTEDREDAWMILGTDGLELGVRPVRSGQAGYELRSP